jgi:hypothetical protein
MDVLKLHRDFLITRWGLLPVMAVFLLLRLCWPGEAAFWQRATAAGIELAVAIALHFLARQYSVVQQRTLLPTFFYLLFTGTDSLFFDHWMAGISLLLFVLCQVILMRSAFHPLSQNNMLNISFVLILGSLYWPPFWLLFPVFWYGMAWFRILNLKNWLAGVMGIVIVLFFLFAWGVYRDEWTVFDRVLPVWKSGLDFQLYAPDLCEWVRIGGLLLLFLLIGVRIFVANISEKVVTVKILRYFYVLALLLAVFLLVQGRWAAEAWLILYFPLSLLSAHYFTYSRRRGEVWMLALFVIFFLSMLGWQWSEQLAF